MDPAPSSSVKYRACPPLGQTGGWFLNPASDYPLTVFGLTRAKAKSSRHCSTADIPRRLTPMPSKSWHFFFVRTQGGESSRITLIDSSPSISKISLHSNEVLRSGQQRARRTERIYLPNSVSEPFRNWTYSRCDLRLCSTFHRSTLLWTTRYWRDSGLMPCNSISATQDGPILSESFQWIIAIALDSNSSSPWALNLRGTDIPMAEILQQLKLKEMAFSCFADLSSSLRRKSAAFAFPLARSIAACMGKLIPFRPLPLLPLPVEFVHLNVTDLATAWRYAHTVAELMQRTYVFGGRAAQSRAQVLSMARSGPLYWTISTADNVTTCPCCLRAASVAYSKQARASFRFTPVVVAWSWSIFRSLFHNKRLRIGLLFVKCLLYSLLCQVPDKPPQSKFSVQIVLGLPSHSSMNCSKGKARFRTPDGFEGYVEQIALHHFQREGWQGVWGENYLWWMIMALLFWDVYFKPIEGAFEPLLLQAGTPQDMPKIYFSVSFSLAVKV